MIVHDVIAPDRLREAAASRWDVLVVGAGPAGSVAACEIARHGKSVLLVDKAFFPRYKVCGCCLNASAAALVEQIGLGHIFKPLDAQPIERIALGASGRIAALELASGGVALSRAAFDNALVQEAVASGASFIDGVEARLDGRTDESRIVELSSGVESVRIAARVVVAADGLLGSLLAKDGEFPRRVASGSLVGVGTTVSSPSPLYHPGTIYMAVGTGGYVGQVCVEGGRIDLAAALDRRSLAGAHGPAQAAQRIVREAGFPWPDEASHLKWSGTPPLSRRLARFAGSRLFVVGDAAAYVEPFTGEGMAWAISSACAVVPFVIEGTENDSPELAARWDAEHRRLLRGRMRVCTALSKLLRMPLLARAAISALASFPWLASPLTRYVWAARRESRYSLHSDTN
jgi:flavin-dependent dehydrogenase